jgi:hypothetical protein
MSAILSTTTLPIRAEFPVRAEFTGYNRPDLASSYLPSITVPQSPAAPMNTNPEARDAARVPTTINQESQPAPSIPPNPKRGAPPSS